MTNRIWRPGSTREVHSYPRNALLLKPFDARTRREQARERMEASIP